MSTFMEVYEELLARDRKREEADKETKLRAEEAQRRILELQQQTQDLQQEKQDLQQEKEISRQQERRATIESLLKARFGELDEVLAAMIQPLSQLSAEDYAQLPLQVFSLSREELLAKFGQ